MFNPSPPSPPSPLLRLALTAALAAASMAAQAQPARVVQASGDARLAGQAASTGQNTTLADGAVLSTAANARLQLRLADGTVLALAPDSEVQVLRVSQRRLALKRGGLRLVAVGNDAWQVAIDERSVRAVGLLQLQNCAAGCALQPGLYGRTSAGEAVLEYPGGRSVLRNRSFRWGAGSGAAARPEVLATAPVLLADSSAQAEAARVRQQAAESLKAGIEAFTQNDDTRATAELEKVRALLPGEPLVDYYQGLIALKRADAASQAQALALLQRYANTDPDGAASRDVPRTLTLLSSTALQAEVAAAVAREREVVATPPEPGSIAVQAFVNQGDPAYRAMAKGLAAMVIADLSRVPGLKVLEREKVQLLVQEARLGDSGLADRDSAVRSGRLMRAEKVVVGNFEVR